MAADTYSNSPEGALPLYLGDSEERELNHLLSAVNDSSAAARTAWLFYLALFAYFWVTVTGVNHTDLLLNKPVHLPFLGIDIELDDFFLYAPIIFLLIHFGVYLQHVLLSRKAEALHQRLRFAEEQSGLGYRGHPMRIRVHSYFFTQIYAGSQRSPVFGSFLHGMNQVSYVVLPVFLFLAFQVNFLAYHDLDMTKWHRWYVVIDLFIIFFMRHFMRKARMSEESLLPALLKQLRVIMTTSLSLVVLAISWFVITIPGEETDKFLSRHAGVHVPLKYDYANYCNDSLPSIISGVCQIFGEPKATIIEKRSDRRAFFLTAYFFEGEVDLTKGESRSWFSRNLIVTDKDLSVARTEITNKINGQNSTPHSSTAVQVKLSLRGRDLRFAVFDRSNLTGVDLTDANLEGASLRRAILSGARISCAETPLRSAIGGRFSRCAKLYGAKLDGADLKDADLRGACFLGAEMKSADLRNSRLFKVNFEAANLTLSRLNEANLSEAVLRGAKLLGADLTAANLRFAKLQHFEIALPTENGETSPSGSNAKDKPVQGFENLLSNIDECRRELPSRLKKRLSARKRTILSDTTLQQADLRLANLQGADLSRADLTGADLHLAQLQGTNMSAADLTASDLGAASLHGADLSDAKIDGAILFNTKLVGTVLRSASLRMADLRRADLSGADLRFATLEGANANETLFRSADLRCSAVSPSFDAARLKGTADTKAQIARPLSEKMRQYQEKLTNLQEAAEKLRGDVRSRKLDQYGDQKPIEVEKLRTAASKAVAPETEDVSGSCSHNTIGLDEKAAGLLGQNLAAITCRDKPNIGYIAAGITKRIVDSFSTEIPRFQSNPLLYISALKAMKANGPKSKDGPSCYTRVAPGVQWQLVLSANLYKSEQDGRGQARQGGQ